VYIDHRTENFHTQLLFKTEEELAKIKELVKQVVHRAIALVEHVRPLVYFSYRIVFVYRSSQTRMSTVLGSAKRSTCTKNWAKGL
jgi:hypothetical protein